MITVGFMNVAAVPAAEDFVYHLRTVSARFRLVGETTVHAASAQAAVDAAIELGYAEAEAAPAVPVNGYPEGLKVRRGDTARRTR